MRGRGARGPWALLVAVGGALLASAPACGSRTQLRDGERTVDAAPNAPFCAVVEDCPGAEDRCRPARCADGVCLYAERVACDDGDPCTDDACEPESGECRFAPRTFDLDGDGHRGPLPGFAPTDPAACGDDCDDTRASAHPGGVEICDGVDNDCNGVVDDDAEYVPRASGPDAVPIALPGFQHSSPVGFASSGDSFFVTYGANDGKARIYGAFIDVAGAPLGEHRRLTQVEADAYGGSVAWTGDRYGVLWNDRRSERYDVFFAAFDRTGQKLAPGDVRLSDSRAFSINQVLVFTGAEFLAVWQEGGGQGAGFVVMAQRVALDGAPIGGPVELATGGPAESPSVAVGRPGLGIAWARGVGAEHRIVFAPFDFALSPLRPPQELARDGAYPEIVWNRDAFVVTWNTNGDGGRTAVAGATLSGLGAIVAAPRVISDSPRFARDATMLPLGDRLLMVYSDTRDQNQGFELYSRTLDARLEPVGAAARVTRAAGDSVFPRVAFGPGGEVGVVFRDYRAPQFQAFYTNLVCRAGGL